MENIKTQDKGFKTQYSKVVLLSIFMFLISFSQFGQLSGVFTIPSVNFSNIASAIASLNAVGVAAPGVTFNVSPAYTETFTSLNAGLINAAPAQPTALAPVVFQKAAGPGLNPIITAAPTGTGALDGIIILEGVSHISFNGIDVRENVANTNNVTSMNWGYALLKRNTATGVTGCQNVRIQDCNITLNKPNSTSSSSLYVTTGIYANNHIPTSTVQLVLTNPSGSNSNNLFTGNRISSERGVHMEGYNDPNTPYSLYDQGNDIGQMGKNMNVIDCSLNSWERCYGVFATYQNDFQVANDSISAFGNAPPPAIGLGGNAGVAIYMMFGQNSDIEINNNVLKAKTSVGHLPSWVVRTDGMGNNGNVSIHDNTIRDITWPAGAVQNLIGISSITTLVPKNVNISNNLFTNLNIPANSGGGFWGLSGPAIYWRASNTLAMNSNTFTGNTFDKGSCIFIGGTASVTASFQNNLITNNNIGFVTWGIINGGTNAGTTSILSNTISNLTVSPSAFNSSTAQTTYMQLIRCFHGGNFNVNVSDNVIENISSRGSIMAVNIHTASTGTPLGTYNLVRNKISGLSSSAIQFTPNPTPYTYGAIINLITGINVGAGSGTVTIANNMLSDFTASTGILGNNASLDPPIIGMNFYEGTINAYHNSIHLNASSIGVDFGVTGISTNVNANVSLINNLIVNTSIPNGIGTVVGHRRNGSSLANFLANSNNNSYFVNAALGGNRFTYFDGTAFPTLANYIAAPGMAPREGNSIAVNPIFSNPLNDLHTNDPSVSNMGVTIPGYNTDFDGQSRSCPPEIGADEFSITSSPTITGVSSLCSGGNTTLTANVGGATSYTWLPGPVVGSTIAVNNLTVTTAYTVTASFAGGCSSSTVKTVTVNTGPVLTVSSSNNLNCTNLSSTLTGVSAGNTIVWNGGSLSSASNPVVVSNPNTYTATATNASGCTTSSVLTVTQNTASPALTASSSNSLNCINTNATLTGVSAGNTIVWNGGSLSNTPNPAVVSSQGSYTATVTNTVNGCQNTTVVAVVQNTTSPSIITASSPSAICSGNTSTLTAIGANSYTWSNNATGAIITVTPGSTTIYTVTGISNANGCLNTKTISVNVTISPTLSINNQTVCPGGTATLTGSGASTYSWNTGSIANPYTVSPTTNTFYVITGSNGNCTDTKTVNVTIGNGISLNPIANPTAICFGATTTLSASGANSYTWTNINNATIVGNSANITVNPTSNTVYNVTGSNGSCSGSSTIAIAVNANPFLLVSSSPSAVCLGNTSTLTAVGANTYTWSNNAPVAIITVTPSSTTIYTVTGTSGNGCTNTKTVTVTVNNNPFLIVASSPSAICSGGSSTLTAIGANTYTWSNNAPGPIVTVTPVSTTVYTVTGTSGNGCSNTKTLSVNVTSTPTVSVNNQTICPGGTANLIAGGASTYSWNTNATTSSITVSPTNNTNYTVTGSNGNCSDTKTVTVTIGNGISLNPIASPTAICYGGTTALSASGANSYTWTNTNNSTIVGNSANVTVNPTITTVYNVTGSNGSCSGSSTIAITVNNNPFLIVASSPSAICLGGSSTLSAVGANTYTWSNNAPGAIITVTPGSTTIYSVTGTSGNGCTNTKTVSVNVNLLPNISASVSNNLSCANPNATLTAISAGNTIAWNGGALSNVSNPAIINTPNTYTATATNGSGCQTSTIVTVTQSTAVPSISANTSNSLNCTSTSATLTATSAGNTIVWNGGNLFNSSNPVVISSQGSYTATATNPSGCASNIIVTVIQNTTTPNISIMTPGLIGCVTQTITLIGNSTTPGVTYSWQPQNVNTSVATATAAGNYTLTVTDPINGCSSSTVTTVTQTTSALSVTAVSSSSAICSGSGSSATLSASGAANYTWMPGTLTGANINVTPASSTIYTVTGISGNCSNSNTISLTVKPSPILLVNGATTMLCRGQSLTLTATGANSYTWANGPTSPTFVISPTVTTNYTVTGIGLNNCSASAVLTQSVADCTGLTQYSILNTQYSVYPNPSTGIINIEAVEGTDIIITNTIGQIVYNETSTSDHTRIDLQSFAHGLYLVRLKKDKASVVFKVIKE